MKLKLKYFLSFKAVVIAYIISFTAYAQIPDPSFESWASGNPTGWSTTNSPSFKTVTQTSDAYAGLYAAKGETIGINGIIIPL